jgi:hypothetical protein
VERLTGVLPCLVDASYEEIDRTELSEVGTIMAAHHACAEIIAARLLQMREAFGYTSPVGVCLP